MKKQLSALLAVFMLLASVTPAFAVDDSSHEPVQLSHGSGLDPLSPHTAGLFNDNLVLSEEESASVKKASESSYYDYDSGLYYDIVDGEVIITGAEPVYGLAEINIPEMIDGYSVTTIGDYAFYRFEAISSLSMPSIIKIGRAAFYDQCYMTSVYMPRVEYIGQSAFAECTSLTELDLPKVKELGLGTFSGCSELISVDFHDVSYLPPSVLQLCVNLISVTATKAKTIGNGAFGGCHDLTEVSIPQALVIDDSAFYNCISLKSLYLPNLTYVGNYAFSDCPELSNITLARNNGTNDYYVWKDYALYTKDMDTLVSGHCLYGDIVIKDDVTHIAEGAFYENAYIRSVTMNNVYSIGPSAFYDSSIFELTAPTVNCIHDSAFLYCGSLIRADISGVEEIGSNAFTGCSSLDTIDVSDSENYTTVDRALYTADMTTLLAYPTASGHVTLPNSVRTIEYGALYATYIESISMPYVTSIKGWALGDCKHLTDVSLSNLEYAAGNSFYGTPWLDSFTEEFVIVGDGVLIDYNGSSEDITVPDSVKCIAAFYNFGIYTGEGGYDFINTLINVTANNATVIGDFGFAYSYVGTLNIPNLKVIGDFAFSNVSFLYFEYSFPNVESIGASSFNETNIESISLPKVTDIPYSAFRWCSYLESVSIPNAESIGKYAFLDCSSLRVVSFPNARFIYDSAFTYSSIEGISIPKIEYIGKEALAYTKIRSLTISANCFADIDELAFFLCRDLSKVIVEGNVNLCNRAFYGCGQLESAYFYNYAPIASGEYLFDECAPNFTIYYIEGTDGWTGNDWNGYPITTFDPSAMQQPGDVNGDGKLNAGDAVIVLRAVAGLEVLNDTQLELADVSGDGKINAGDAVKLLRVIAGLEVF